MSSGNNKKNQAGVTIFDILFILVILVVIIMIVAKIGDVRQAGYREECWKGQKILDQTLTNFLLKENLEIYQIFTAYTFYDPSDAVKYKMVVILNPMIMDPFVVIKEGAPVEELEKGPTKLVFDMTETNFGQRVLCPMRNGNPQYIAVDYWYLPTKGWNCMYNKYHN